MPERKPRTAIVRLDRVEVGHTFAGGQSNAPKDYDDATVITSGPHPNDSRLWRITWAGGYFCASPGYQVSVVDESGLIGLKHDLKVYGPFVCGSGDMSTYENAGTIHFSNVRISGGPVICDLIIRRNDKTVTTIKHVEVGHIEAMARSVAKNANDNSETPRYCSTHKDGCGEYHVPGIDCPLPDRRP